MTTIEELTTDFSTFATEMADGLGAVNSKLDEIANFIATLKAGTVTQEQLDQAGASLNATRTLVNNAIAALLAKTDALDEPSA